MASSGSARRPLRRQAGESGRRRPDLLAWIVVVLAFAFGFGILLQPSGSLVLSPMEHARLQAEARDRTIVVNHASEDLAVAWPLVAEGD
jgi:hypothetical protein